jgi:hypothetical protein
MKKYWSRRRFLTSLILLGSGLPPICLVFHVSQTGPTPIIQRSQNTLAFGGERQKQTSGVSFRPEPGRIDILIDEKSFTSYHYQGFNKPIFFPVRAPSGIVVTRGYPMIPDIKGEATDHPHQKGIWLTHGDVNGVDFWTEGMNTGRIIHRGFDALEGGAESGILRSHNEWEAPSGELLLKEMREVRILNRGQVRVMDFRFRLMAVNRPVKFGDTKEGTFGIRLAQVFSEKDGGRIENSLGGVGEKQCWGRRADWVAYPATIGTEKLTVAIFDHPSSFRHPTYWHARGYTLFAANPFGLRDFTGDRSQEGSFILEKGESMVLRYRVYLGSGSIQEAQIAKEYRAYIEETE